MIKSFEILVLLLTFFLFGCSTQKSSYNSDSVIVEGIFIQEFTLETEIFWLGKSYIKTKMNGVYELTNNASSLDVRCFKSPYSKLSNIFEEREFPEWIPGEILQEKNIYKDAEKVKIGFKINVKLKKIEIKEDSCRKSLQNNTCNKIDFSDLYLIEEVYNSEGLNKNEVQSLGFELSKGIKFKVCN